MTTSLSHKFVGSLVHQKNANDLKDCTTNKLIQSEWNHIEDETPAIQNHILEKIKKRTTGNNVDKKKSQEILKEECLSSLDQIKKILLVNNKIDKNLKSKLIKEINLIKNTKKRNKKTKNL
jgi:lantibiotic modifying enzyme